MERMLHRKLVGMNRVGELQGGMFFWVGGAWRLQRRRRCWQWFHHAASSALQSSERASEGLFSTQQRCGISFVFGRRPLSLLLSLFLRQRQLRINAGIAQMSCLTVLFVIISRPAGGFMSAMLAINTRGSHSAVVDILPLSLSVAARNRTEERAA